MSARLIGVIGKPHGVKGEVYIRLLTDYPKTIYKGCILYLEEECKNPIKVENLRTKKTKKSEYSLIKFKGINSRNDAEQLRGSNLFRKEEDSPKLKEGQYWVDELLGCLTYTSAGKYIGKVVDVLENVANSIIIIKIEEEKIKNLLKQDTILIPLREEFIDKVNIEESKILIKKIPEYM